MYADADMTYPLLRDCGGATIRFPIVEHEACVRKDEGDPYFVRQLLPMDGEAGAEAAIGTAPGAATAYRHEPAPGRGL